ncbi:hypothetical protein O9G_005564 [Rozella allomycis CSF55]|uniref:Uncharacterized protein n=1 Tax=Rozella allomycis (strain CSF55) TaxID=988480 RepID=A0A075AQF5_ROZAC|nr:hypothetical protein O9G_005564 [Rozella allomycis CSF55]|eukprot:EPZ30945.1 hypothetical protein O9G_005564 [Rozella allomycis CSF55]
MELETGRNRDKNCSPNRFSLRDRENKDLMDWNIKVMISESGFDNSTFMRFKRDSIAVLFVTPLDKTLKFEEHFFLSSGLIDSSNDLRLSRAFGAFSVSVVSISRIKGIVDQRISEISKMRETISEFDESFRFIGAFKD